MKKLTSVLGIFLLYLSVHCSQNNANPIGASLIDSGNLGVLKVKSIIAAPSDTSFASTVQTGSGDYLYAGNMEDIKASTLFRFTGFEDTASLDSAVLLLNVYRVINKNMIPGTVHVYTVTSDWDDLTLDRDSFTEDMIGNLLGTIMVPADTVDSLFFKLDPDLVSQWMDTTSGVNHGIYLQTDDDLMIQFYSRDISSSAATGPQLNLYFSGDSTRYPEVIEATDDLFLASSETAPDSDFLTIENGTAIRTFLEFDLSSLTPEIIINRATLILVSDSLETLPRLDETVSLTACYLDSNYSFDTMECISANSAAGLAADGKCEIEFTWQIQEIISDQLNNPGFLVKGTFESSQINRLRFFSSTADSANRPVLKIYYTVPPAPSI